MEEVETMVKFHCSIVQPLMRCFIEETPSTTEETKLMRGFYRFQLCCNIYGLEAAESIPYVSWISISQRILGDFLCIFDPWEAEEISCVSNFCEEKCEQIFDQTKQGLDEENSGIDQPDISDITSPSKLTRNRGLELLHLVYPIKDQDHLVVTRQLPPPMRPSGVLSDLHSVFEQHLQWYRHCVHPRESDHRQERREPLIFQCDRKPDGSCALPPLAWTIIWGGSYSNLFGEYIPDASCEWAWVMWDADRLKRMSVLGVIIQEWEKEHHDDPRKDYW
ncbi:hypothetical protein CBS147333_3236 [Penicillium roqueforti]|nr:hypothetical protein CBS147354_3450 [Penicillium roqueforti]KAI3112728.1 hypothetical protein CBS147333_3236 [Penicillium roqueforti]KAI3129770.1 hypothetical protein CBS147326_6219 [Penicillium roqueforti]KAI3269804.1 hypothetical protein CBS147308_5317 [Penicillium roqueforti]KAI3292935.1 hypothetical protein DTO002I6_5293 [Penicillium roqueforti]